MFINDNWKSYSNRGQQAASKSISVPAELSSFTKDTDSLKPVPKLSRQLSLPASLRRRKKNKPGYGRCKSISTLATGRAPDIAGMVSTVDDVTLMPTSTLCGKNAKALPSLENGFLVQIFRYTRQRIPTLNEYCVVCDEPQIFQNGAMLQVSH
ncbi:protein mono-ADP-ribosyltransferase PARP6-like [Gigantopelta aegis]|uniref:protein mono-ADP-ribosyltransferase PARP6-like n=1 Tax=Gigantopelta aegis TaxID=1735272 RepID=UPI001B88BC97|nr:protein mono-ADP-ribosyltransferase PARP6-like [Gigantopelta aegis]